MPSFTIPVHEANDCHHPAGSPEGGQFCAKTSVGALAFSAWDEGARAYLPKKAVWYSFPAGGDWTAERVKSWPASKLKALTSCPRCATFATVRQGAILEQLLGVPDKPGHLTVYRLGSKTGGLDNRNAASLWGLATFLNQEGFGVLQRGMYVTAYYVKAEVTEGPRFYTSFARQTAGATR